MIPSDKLEVARRHVRRGCDHGLDLYSVGIQAVNCLNEHCPYDSVGELCKVPLAKREAYTFALRCE